MSVTLSPDDRKTAIASIERFCTQQLEFEASQVQATQLLDFFLKEIAPSVSNAAISAATPIGASSWGRRSPSPNHRRRR